VFGMGTGVAPPLESPGNFEYLAARRSFRRRPTLGDYFLHAVRADRGRTAQADAPVSHFVFAISSCR